MALFNECVSNGDFSALLAEFAPDAVVKFENVPGAGTLEFQGLRAITKAYERQPPDDKIDLTTEAFEDGESIVVPFAWRADGSTGVMRLTYADGRLAQMVVIFD
ncbi:nuclear transport factor 2 family protein [Actinomadura decatromicini]|uniref:Nuclear transport factor 2 family protein n=1 Tax=Actinomadura decatromicini TaxID=2604572 RepID=A0A5D3FUA2_9ACTN|nr:nuclear transport factor 2 family protein [Actinomadura decatromicini]TYK51446.1 nuclear transport factor 2 family protein [Actinomadura decatromicini]